MALVAFLSDRMVILNKNTPITGITVVSPGTAFLPASLTSFSVSLTICPHQFQGVNTCETFKLKMRSTNLTGLVH
jgi:hypothetical protein